MTRTTVDILVVGAGSAGCALAARASENPNQSVLLLEAGPDYPDPAATPWDLVNGHDNSYHDHDWGLAHRPTAGREVAFPRGRVTGGSSAVNTAIALRSLPEDHAAWADAGNGEWCWDRVLPVYRRLERDLDFPDAPHHGDAGPIPIRRYPPEELVPAQQAFLAAAEALGYPHCADANDPASWGAGPQPMNKLGRLRVSCALGYLAPARARPNLSIRPQTLVRRLIIRKGRCRGVEVNNADGRIERIDARLVVLCAGALMSPAILLRSGIGPSRELTALGIDPVAEVPGVGANLCDHPALAVVCTLRPGCEPDRNGPIIQTILRYTAPGSTARNDLQIEQLSFVGGDRGPPRFGIAAVLEQVEGRGRLTLSRADPQVPPQVENAFCEDERDAGRLADALQDALAFTRQPPLSDRIESVQFPDPTRAADRSALMALVRRFAGSGYHPCGTVKMGPRDDTLAVVDQSGCCHAVDALVVADAAIMPSVPRANTNLTSILIGERIGEWLRTRPGHYGL